MDKIEKKFLKTNEFKLILGIHRNTVINWIHTGKLRANSINGHYYIPVAEVDRIRSENG